MAFAAKNKKWLGYALYVVLVSLVLLYYLFPAQAVEEVVDSSVSRMNPDLGFKADSMGPWIPAGLRIKSGRIYSKDIQDPPVFLADSMYIGPRIMQLLKGEYSIDLAGRAYNGDIKGLLHAKGEPGASFESRLSLNGLDVSEYEFLAAKLKHRVTGKLSGDIVYGRESANTPENGRAELRLTGGQLQLETPLFGISSVDLQNIDLLMELGNGEITISRAELAGSEIKASLTGSIQLQPDMNQSLLNLKGTLEPLAEFYKNYPEIRELLKSMRKRVRRGQYFFTITGTLGEPRFRFQ